MTTSLTWVLLIFAHLIQYSYSQSNTYSITPQSNSNDLYTVKIHNKNSGINIESDPPSWRLQNPSKPYSWAFHLQSTTKLFQFPSSKCSLNISIHGQKQSNDARLFYVFSIGSTFFSFANGSYLHLFIHS